MKYGLVIFKDTDNLGDDIQSYAVSKFLPSIDYLIERERLNEFSPNINQKIAVIFSGWYLYSHFNWPPSPYIYPLLISIHFDTYYSRIKDKTLVDNMVLDGYGAKWLNLYGPVGSRDYFTKNLLETNNISSYFSGCITLTLNKRYLKKINRIVLTDVDEELENEIRKHTNIPIIKLTHKIKLNKYSFEKRKEIIENYLEIYETSSLVITGRLHAALPCLAFDTPVLFIKDERFLNRIGSFLPYFNYYTKDELIKSFDYDLNHPLDNPKSICDIREKINNTCAQFVNSCEKLIDIQVSDKELFVDQIERTNHFKNLLSNR